MIVFDTEVVDLSEKLSDPVDVQLGVQFGGGTDINRALGYTQSLVQRPEDTIVILISESLRGRQRAPDAGAGAAACREQHARHRPTGPGR